MRVGLKWQMALASSAIFVGIGQTIRMLTISPPPEWEEQLRLEAASQGIAPEEFLLQKLAAIWAPPHAPETADDETAALDELVGCLADVPSIPTSWRRQKEEEMALEEENFLRDFRGRQTR